MLPPPKRLTLLAVLVQKIGSLRVRPPKRMTLPAVLVQKGSRHIKATTEIRISHRSLCPCRFQIRIPFPPILLKLPLRVLMPHQAHNCPPGLVIRVDSHVHPAVMVIKSIPKCCHPYHRRLRVLSGQTNLLMHPIVLKTRQLHQNMSWGLLRMLQGLGKCCI